VEAFHDALNEVTIRKGNEKKKEIKYERLLKYGNFIQYDIVSMSLRLSNGDLLWRGFCGLGNSDFQNTILVLGIDFGLINVLRQRDSARERSVATLLVSDIILFVFRLAVAFARDDQVVSLSFKFDVLLLDTRQFGVDSPFLFILVDIQCRSHAVLARLLRATSQAKVSEEVVKDLVESSLHAVVVRIGCD